MLVSWKEGDTQHSPCSSSTSCHSPSFEIQAGQLCSMPQACKEWLYNTAVQYSLEKARKTPPTRPEVCCQKQPIMKYLPVICPLTAGVGRQHLLSGAVPYLPQRGCAGLLLPSLILGMHYGSRLGDQVPSIPSSLPPAKPHTLNCCTSRVQGQQANIIWGWSKAIL